MYTLKKLNGNKYLTLVPFDNLLNQKLITQMIMMKKYMKNKFDSDGNLTLDKMLGLHNVIVLGLFFMKTTNTILRFSWVNVSINYKCYILIELTCLK